MQVILRDDVPALGNAGEIVNVRDGYARNYLLPKKIAVKADATNLKMLEHERRAVASRQAVLKKEAETLAAKIRKTELLFQRESGEEGKLFGSVTAHDILDALAEKDVTVDRRRLRLQEPIKAVGEFEIEVRLHAEVQATVRVRVEAIATA